MPDALDPRLSWKLHRYLERRRQRAAAADEPDHEGNERIVITLKFRDSIEPLRAAGFADQTIEGDIAVGSIRLADLERLSQVPQLIRAEASRRLSPSLNKSVPEIRADIVHQGSPAYTGTNVVVGIVDSGVDIFHTNLRKDNGDTRILRLWDQTLTPTGAQHAPAGYTKGVEFDAAAINAGLATPETAFASQDYGHGTHVASIAAGDGSQSDGCHGAGTYVGVAPAAALIVVKTTFNDVDVVAGVDYVFKNTPAANGAVVNLSLGSDSGAHDGQAFLDQRLNNKLNGTTGRVVVASSGNAASAQHARKTIAAGTTGTITYEVGSKNAFSDDFDIWYGGAARLELTLKLPSGGSTPPLAAGGGTASPVVDGHKIEITSTVLTFNGMHQISFRPSPPAAGSLANGSWVISLRETAGTDADVNCWIMYAGRAYAEADIAASGTGEFKFSLWRDWKRTDECEITYSGDARLDIVVTTPGGDSIAAVAAGDRPDPPPSVAGHFIQVVSLVDETPGRHRITFSIRRDTSGAFGSKKNVKTGTWVITLTETKGKAANGVQARLAADRWNLPEIIKAERNSSVSIGSPAAADNVIAVGSYDYRSGKLDEMSGRGPRLDGGQKPDVAAPGVQIFSAKSGARGSPLCCDCCVDFYVSLTGTSMAAPHVTGVVALMLQKNPGLTFTEVRDKLRTTARHTPGPPDPDYNDDWGWGKVDAEGAINSVTAAAPGPPALPMIFLPLAASAWQLYQPTMQRLRDLQLALASTPAGVLLAALVSQHYDEVARLVRTVRRVAAAWRRMAGPALIREVLSWEDPDQPVLPKHVAGRPLSEGLERLVRELLRVASPSLREAIGLHRPLVQALPGASLTDLTPLLTVPHGGSGRDARAHRA